jgi:hypothetical protein
VSTEHPYRGASQGSRKRRGAGRSGPLETPEFATIKTVQGFRNLLTMDTYQNVRMDVHCPPILISMGMNDARIAP